MSKSKKQKHKNYKLPASTTLAKKPATDRYILLLLFTFSFLLYSNTLKYNYCLDDDIVTRGNKFVQQGLDGISSILKKGYYFGFNGENEGAYRPVVSINFAIEKELFGEDPQTSHLFNVLFYALTCVVLFILLRKLFPGYLRLIPLLITLLFIAHPIHTEVVANIKSRDEILHLLFALLTLNLLVDYINKQKLKYFVLSIITYFMCVLSKEIGLTLVIVIPLLLYFFTDEKIKKILKLSIPFWAIAVIYMFIRASVLDDVAFGEKMDIINNSLAAVESTSEHFATCFVILGKYLYLLFVPHPLSWDYSYNQIPVVNWFDISSVVSLLVYIAMGIYAIYGLKKKDAIAFGIFFYLIMLALVSNLFVQIGATLGERFLYAPSFGFCLALVILIARLFKINPASAVNKNKTSFITVLALITILYAFKTYDRNAAWENNFTLFSADIGSVPNSARAHFALASEYRTAGENEQNVNRRKLLLDKAESGYLKSIEIYPEFTSSWYNLGVTYYARGENENSLNAYKKVLAINPNHKDALNNSGVIYFNRKDYDTALEYFLKAVENNPNYGDPYANIGAVYHNKGEYNKAIQNYEKALQFNPNNVNVNNNLGKLYNNLGEKDKADYYFRKAGTKY